MDSDQDELIHRYLSGAASDTEIAALQVLLQADPALMRRIFAAAEIERDLYSIFRPGTAQSETKLLQALKSGARKSTSSSRLQSARRMQPPRKRAETKNLSWVIPAGLAACAAIALLLFFNTTPARRQTATTPPSPAPAPKSTVSVQKTRTELANVEAEQRRIQQQLLRIDRERQELTRTVPSATTQEELERTANLERIEAERRRVAAELEQMRAARTQLQESLAVAQDEDSAPAGPGPLPKIDVPSPAPQAAPAELAQITYVAETGPKPVLVRNRAGTVTRTPATIGTALLAGDKIEIAKGPAVANDKRETRLSIQLWCGQVDFADDALIEFVDFERLRLQRGQLFADLNLSQRDAREETRGLYQVVFDTPLADVVVEGTRFDLSTDTAQTRLRMEEGKTSFITSRGRQLVYALQESLARGNAAPAKPQSIKPAMIWRGRRGAPPNQVVSFTLINAETGKPIEAFDPLLDGAELKLSKLPSRLISVRANTVPEQVGSVRFGLNANSAYNVESFHPYALSDDNSAKYDAWNVSEGSHTITATPFSEAGAKGKAGIPHAITIRVGP